MDDDKQNLEQELDNLSYEDLCEITQSSLRRLIAADPLLQDLPGDVTTEEVLAQIAVAQGKSITVVVLRHYETPLHVVIPQLGTTVRDLKRAIQRNFTLRQQRLRSKTKISWGYVWRTYDLLHWGKPMSKDGELVSNYGVVNRSEIRFGKKLRRKAETC
ncbi:U11/U12 small nuclear ribonucleoprotein 25 kDa protein-like [Zophobas morio]|uniref:U11/U12 small nuclear ribonucleoprotein 25 kDa protein-like n=1 Tax=Zophobas morio TaxID=2755281 RepID=UPI003083E257